MAEGYELNYFPLRGRGEVIRLALIAAGASYTEVSINYADMKEFAGTSKYPFGQAPTFHHNGIILAQMDAILRYVARLHNLYGENIIEQSFIDMVLIGVEGLRTAYTDLIYGKQLSEEGRLEHFRKHLSKETEKDRNGGSHFAYFEALLARNNNGTAFVVGNNLSIADIQVGFFFILIIIIINTFTIFTIYFQLFYLSNYFLSHFRNIFYYFNYYF